MKIVKRLALLAVLFILICFAWLKYIEAQERRPFIGDINEQVTILRDGYDLPPLVEDKQLAKYALLKCNDMVERRYFAHQDPEGSYSWQTYNFGEYNEAGENLAIGYRNAVDTVNGWKASKTHLDNLTNKAYSKVGYATCMDKMNQYITVQLLKG